MRGKGMSDEKDWNGEYENEYVDFDVEKAKKESYQPPVDILDEEDPPAGGSGVPDGGPI
jgi:hypothetical protein